MKEELEALTESQRKDVCIHTIYNIVGYFNKSESISKEEFETFLKDNIELFRK